MTRTCVAWAVLVGAASCSQRTAPLAGLAGGNGDPPGPMAGWEREFDGFLCRHPTVRADCRDGWCRVPAGCFIKGSPADEPGHPAYVEDQRAVTLTHDVWVQQYEVSQAQWSALGFRNPSGSAPDDGGGDCVNDERCPVGNVSWFEATAFANRLSATHTPPLPPCYVHRGCTGEVGEGMVCDSVALTTPTLYDCPGYRLLSDAEFEYALRAGTTDAFYAGPIIAAAVADRSRCDPYGPLAEIAWYCGDSQHGFTHPVGQKRPNAWHLYDMSGNAEEWVHDEETGRSPPAGPLTDPGGTLRDYRYRRTRGGAAYGWPTLLRSAAALSGSWGYRQPTFGFRLARTVASGGSDGAMP